MGRGGTETECCSPRRLWVRLLNGGNDVTAEENYVDFDDDVLIEPEPANLPRGIRMQKLTKVRSDSFSGCGFNAFLAVVDHSL